MRMVIFQVLYHKSMALCPGDEITILDPLTNKYQCQQCRKCSPGEGLSVKCGDVIDPNTAIVCKPCVLGDTYSSYYEPGACRDCKNCAAIFRETKKACTLTSKAECGACMRGFYPDGFIGLCQPCSNCCYDGSDNFPVECDVSGVPMSKRCSVHQAEKCEKTASMSPSIGLKPTSVKNVQPRVEVANTTQISSSLVPITTSQMQASVTQTNVQAPSPFLYATAVFVPLIFLAILLVVIWRCKKKRNRKNKADDADTAGRVAAEESGTEVGLEAAEGNSGSFGVEETESPMPAGLMESQPPGSYNQGNNELSFICDLFVS